MSDITDIANLENLFQIRRKIALCHGECRDLIWFKYTDPRTERMNKGFMKLIEVMDLLLLEEFNKLAEERIDV